MADTLLKTMWLLHGVNLDMLGRRDPAHYGSLTLPELETMVAARAAARGFSMSCFQTNHEGDLVEKLHEIAQEGAAAVIINPGAWTHYSYAIRDALELVTAPVAEVHLSAVDQREKWRHLSVIEELTTIRISGRGVGGYMEAVDKLADAIAAEAGT